MYAGPRASGLLNVAETSSFHHEYSALACTVEIVEDVYAAIDHINQHGRHVGVIQINFIFNFYIIKIIVSENSLAVFAVLILNALLQKIVKLLRLS